MVYSYKYKEKTFNQKKTKTTKKAYKLGKRYT